MSLPQAYRVRSVSKYTDTRLSGPQLYEMNGASWYRFEPFRGVQREQAITSWAYG